MLRTMFVKRVTDDTSIHQIVLRTVCPEIQILTEPCEEDTLRSILAERRKLVPEENQIPYRLTLATTYKGSVLFVLECSHAIVDGTSSQILMRELASAYDEAVADHTDWSYRDYIQYLHDTASSRDCSESFWATYLSEVHPCLFPTLSASNGEMVGPKQIRDIALEPVLTSKLDAFCQARGWTPSNLLQMAWGLVLRAYTNSDTVCFGYLTSGRDVPIHNIQNTVGPLINMLVCGLDLSSSRIIEDLLNLNQASYVDALSYQHFSLFDIMRVAGQQGGPLFNTIMSVQKAIGTPLKASSVQVKVAGGEDPSEVSK